MNFARLLLSSLFIAIMVWLWYPYLFTGETKPNVNNEIDMAPDYTAHDLKQTIFDENGKISHKVSAKKMESYQDIGFTHFSEPTFIIYSEDETWQIKAYEAILYENKKLLLEQDVEAVNLNPNAMIQKIAADQIEINILASTMRSEHEVKMTGPNLLIVGQGLNADLIQETLELINHTQTIYYDQ